MNPSVAPSPNVLDRLVRRARRLYSLPAVALQVVELTDQPEIDVAALQACIQNDPALTSKILRIVNSSLFGLPTKVGDLQQALALLGSRHLRMLVLGFSVPDELVCNLTAEILQRYWRHALVKAVAAREISEQVWQLPSDEAFLAGLLQDVGMLVLIQDLGEPYVTFLEHVWTAGGNLAELETSTLGFDHGVLSARLLEAWGLPSPLVQAIGQPLNLERLRGLPEEQGALPQILHLAEIVALWLGQDRAELLQELLTAGSVYRGMSPRQVEQLVAALENHVGLLAEIFAVPLAETDYRHLLAQAHAQLACAADESAGTLPATPAKRPPGLSTAWEETSGKLAGAVENLAAPPQPVPGSTGNPPGDVPPDLLAGWLPHAAAETVPRAATNDPGLEGHVALAVAHSRRLRSPISLALIELDDYEPLILTRGVAGALQAVERLGEALAVLLDGEGQLLPASEARFAVILADYDRQQAVALMRQVVQGVRNWSVQQSDRRDSVRSISAGLATLSMPPKSFPTRELVDAAQRCLDGVQLSGGDSVKSIDLY